MHDGEANFRHLGAATAPPPPLSLLAQRLVWPMSTVGWQEGWSEEYGAPYYFNEAIGHTQWHPPETDPSRPPAASVSASTTSTQDAAEAAIVSALGFVDPIVHAVATKILADECDRATAVKRLRRHLTDVDAAACATAIFERASRPHDSDTADSDSAASSGAEAGAARGPEDSVAVVAPWETPHTLSDNGAGTSSEPTAAGLRALSVGELKRRVVAAGLDSSLCLEKADLIAALTQGLTQADGGCRSQGGASASSVLHDEIAAFALWTRPATEELRARSAVKRLISRVLQQLAAGTRLEPYGSSTLTGGAGGRERLGLFSSDLDLVRSHGAHGARLGRLVV